MEISQGNIIYRLSTAYLPRVKYNLNVVRSYDYVFHILAIFDDVKCRNKNTCCQKNGSIHLPT